MTDESCYNVTCEKCVYFWGTDCRRFPPVNCVWSDHVGQYGEDREVSSYWSYPQIKETTPACGEYNGVVNK